MKNQYIADIGDYGKYSLLRQFENADVHIGINWYLTKDDGSNDGKFIKYLSDEKMRRYDSAVYDRLKKILEKGDRSVSGIESSKLFNKTNYYSEIMDFIGTPAERTALRYEWHHKALSVLKDTSLIFLDPDNGLLTSGNSNKRFSEKYVLPIEIRDYYRAGHNVVFYCHKGRRTNEQWEEYKRFMHKMIPYSKSFGLTFHKGSQRSYIFLVHPKEYEEYIGIISSVLDDWEGVFTYEKVDMSLQLKNIYSELRKYIEEKQPKHDQMREFLDTNNMLVGNYYNYLSSEPINVDLELKRLDSCDIETCSALLTMLYREDHFNEGAYERRWEKGEVQIVIQRLMDLISC